MTQLPSSSQIAPDHFESITDMAGIEAARAVRDERGQLRTTDSLYRNRLEARMFEIAKGEAQQPRQTASAPQPAGGVQIDQAAFARLQELRQQKGAKADGAWLSQWERDMAAVLEGRRLDESLDQFQARQRGEPPGEVSVPEGVDVEDLEAFERLTSAARDAGIGADVMSGIFQAVAEVAEQPAGEQWTEAPFEMFGYRVAVPGVTINRADPQIYAAMKAARVAGVSQTAVDQLLAAYAGAY